MGNRWLIRLVCEITEKLFCLTVISQPLVWLWAKKKLHQSPHETHDHSFRLNSYSFPYPLFIFVTLLQFSQERSFHLPQGSITFQENKPGLFNLKVRMNWISRSSEPYSRTCLPFPTHREKQRQDSQPSPRLIVEWVCWRDTHAGWEQVPPCESQELVTSYLAWWSAYPVRRNCKESLLKAGFLWTPYLRDCFSNFEVRLQNFSILKNTQPSRFSCVFIHLLINSTHILSSKYALGTLQVTAGLLRIQQ